MANGDEWCPDSQLTADSPHLFKPGMTPAEYVAAEAAALVPTIHAVAKCLLANDLDRARSYVSDAMPHMRPTRLTQDQNEQGKYFGPPPDEVNGALNRIYNVLVRDVTGKRLWFDWVERIQAVVRSASTGLVEVYLRSKANAGSNPAASDRQLGAIPNKELATRLSNDADVLHEFASQHAPTADDSLADRPTGGVPSVRDKCTHSDDFSSVLWFGTMYDFTPNQAKCVRILWDHWERGGLAVSSQTIRDGADVSAERLDVVFRDHPAWGTMIVAAAKGSYRLAEPSISIPSKSARAKSTGK